MLAIPSGKGGHMARSHRLLSLLAVLAMIASTGCTAIGYSVGSEISQHGGERSGGPHDARGSDEPLQSPPAASAPDSAAALKATADSSAVGTPATDATDSKRGMNSTLVVIGVLAVVAGLIFLVAR